MASAATVEAYKAKLAAEAGIRLKLEDLLEPVQILQSSGSD